MPLREAPPLTAAGRDAVSQPKIHHVDPSANAKTYGPGEVSQFVARSRGGASGASAAPKRSHPAHDLRWLNVLADGLGHHPYLIEAEADGRSVGRLPLAFVRSRLFGRFLVSLPYLNSGGVTTDDPTATGLLVDEAVRLAEVLDCRYLELRHERRCEHPALSHEMTAKVHMRLSLPAASETLWSDLNAKVRNQVRKGQKQNFSIHWGRDDLLEDFYVVFCRNMRDLGTPVFGRSLFRSILQQFTDESELCVVRDGTQPIAAALLVHGGEVTEVPSASSLREYNSSNANMLMYWQLLQRAIERGLRTFDFGRSTAGGPHYRFKSQWGAEPEPAVWQYHLRSGSIDQMRPDQARNRRLVQLWRKLPVWATRILGPPIVRGIP